MSFEAARNSALVPWRKIRDRSETLAWAIFSQSHLFAKGEGCGSGRGTKQQDLSVRGAAGGGVWGVKKGRSRDDGSSCDSPFVVY